MMNQKSKSRINHENLLQRLDKKAQSSHLKKEIESKVKTNLKQKFQITEEKTRQFNYMNDQGIAQNQNQEFQIFEFISQENNQKLKPNQYQEPAGHQQVNKLYENPILQKQNNDQQQPNISYKQANNQYQNKQFENQVPQKHIVDQNFNPHPSIQYQQPAGYQQVIRQYEDPILQSQKNGQIYQSSLQNESSLRDNIMIQDDSLEEYRRQQKTSMKKNNHNHILSYELEHQLSLNQPQTIQETISFQNKYGYNRNKDLNIFDQQTIHPQQQVPDRQSFKQKYGYDQKLDSDIFKYDHSAQASKTEYSSQRQRTNHIFSYQEEMMEQNRAKEQQRKNFKNQFGDYLGYQYNQNGPTLNQQQCQNNSQSQRPRPVNNIFNYQNDTVSMSTYQANNLSREQTQFTNKI